MKQTVVTLPAVELEPQEVNLWDHKVGPRAEVHLSAAEYDNALKSRLFFSGNFVEFEIVVSENGRVDSATMVGGTRLHVEEAGQIELARVFKPWVRDGVLIRAKLHDDVRLLPPERWADVAVPFPDPWDLKSVSIALKRTACYGFCPAYEVTVLGDGTVRFSGHTSVLIPGDHAAHIPPRTVHELVLAFKKADFFSARSEYAGNVTDNPTQTLTLTVAGRTKTVVDYVGIEAGLPLAIENLENQIDESAGTARWVKGDERTLASLEEERWSFAAPTRQNVELYVTAISTRNAPLIERYLAAPGPIASPEISAISPVCAASAIGDLRLVERMMQPRATEGAESKKVEVAAEVAQQCLLSAARSGNVTLLDYWLKHGADPTAQPVNSDQGWESGLGILANGVMSGNPEMVRRLLEFKVDVKALVGQPPLLMIALERPNQQTPRIVEMLAKAGADVNARGNMDETPIFAANYAPEAIKPLLAAGAELEARDANGNTALIRYAFMEPMVRELLADGADPTLVAKNGDTALKVAKQYICAACATLIEAAVKQRSASGGAGSSKPLSGQP